MKIITIKDMIRKDVPIYYRKLFTGVAVIELSQGPADYRIDFIIEYKPTGQKEISISFIDKVDYPLIPLNREIKQYINNQDVEGLLPD